MLDFLNKAKFTQMVEDNVRGKQLSYMEAVINVCEDNDLEIEEIKKFISPVVKEKIEAEAMSLNFLPRQNTLPMD